MSEEKIVLGIPDVMKLLGVSRPTVEKIMWGNHFPIVRIGRRVLVHKEILEKWLKTGGNVD